jgi:hypothetical protein
LIPVGIELFRFRVKLGIVVDDGNGNRNTIADFYPNAAQACRFPAFAFESQKDAP